MTLQQYSRVKLLTNRFESEGATRGDIGFIIEVYDDDNYEVEFSNASGISTAQIVANERDLESVEDRDK